MSLLQDEYDIDAVAASVRLSGGRVGAIFKHAIRGFAVELSDNVLDIVSSSQIDLLYVLRRI